MNASDDGDSNGNGNHPFENEQRIKKGKGRQKITMAKIENDTNLQVTFSKRRAGVFKKASELSTLCGAESAVVVFSPGNKPHSFGHPDVETVANRFLHANGGDAPPRTNGEQLIMAHNDAAMHQRNNELVGIEAQLELERQRKKELDNRIQRPPPLDELSYEQLEQLKKSVLGFKHELEAKVNSAAAVGNPSWGPLTYEPFNNSNPVNHGAPSFATSYNSAAGNHEYTMVHYPPVGPSGGFVHGYSYDDPSAVVPYNAGTANSDAGPSGSSSQYQRFGGDYRRS